MYGGKFFRMVGVSNEAIQIALAIKFWADKVSTSNSSRSDGELLEEAASTALFSMWKYAQVEFALRREKER